MKKFVLTLALSGFVIVIIVAYILYERQENKLFQNDTVTQIESDTVPDVIDVTNNNSIPEQAPETKVQSVELGNKEVSVAIEQKNQEVIKSNPQILSEQANSLYKTVSQNGSATDIQKAEFIELKNKINNLKDDEKANIIFNEILDEEVIGAMDLNYNPVSFIALQGFRRPILVNLDDEENKQKNTFTQKNTEMGLAFTLTDNEIVSSYFYNDLDQFTGVVRLSKNSDSMRFVHEQISGIDTRLLGDTIYHMITNLKSATTFYLVGHSLNFAQVRLEEVNKTTPLVTMEFPVSSSTLVSVSLEMIDDVLHIGKWNFDFDGDDKTDLTLGNSQEFNDTHTRLALEKMMADSNLSESDRQIAKTALSEI